MILNKKLWAVVDPTETFVVWHWESPLINKNKEELELSFNTYKNEGTVTEFKNFLNNCKIKQVYVSIVEK